MQKLHKRLTISSLITRWIKRIGVKHEQRRTPVNTFHQVLGTIRACKGRFSEAKASMPPRRRLSTLDRGRALGWLQEGISGREVSRRLGVSHSVIQRLQERFQTTGSVQDRPRPGRPRVTTRRQDRLFLLSTLRERTTTARTLRSHLIQTSNVNISESTVRRRLREFGLSSRAPAVRVPLNQRHRQVRMAFCRRHQRWTRQQWGRVLFTDESRFTLSHCAGPCVATPGRTTPQRLHSGA